MCPSSTAAGRQASFRPATCSGTLPPALSDAAPASVQTVAILADDLIWSTRLADAVRAAGGQPRVLRRLEDLAATAAASAPAAVIVDLTARAYDGLEAIRAAMVAGAR